MTALRPESAMGPPHAITVPLLLEAGDADGIVGWRQKKNQIDCQRRILAWFGHYLKGEPAGTWITEGQSYLDRQAEVKRMTEKK